MHAGQPDPAGAPDLASPTIEHLQAALATSRVICTAVGILMNRYGVSDDTAFAHLRRISQESNRKLRDIAADMVDAANGQAKARGVRDHDPCGRHGG